MSKRWHNILFCLAIAVFIANILYIWNSEAMKNSWMGNDEYFFYRTTTNLPDVSTTGGWLLEDDAPNPEGVDRPASLLFDKAYTTPIWIHPLLANAVAYPVAILFDDVANQIQWLRLFDVGIIIITVVLFLDVIRRKTNGLIAGVCVLPLLVGRYLLANGIMFYNDLFMWLFFALTLWVITVNPKSKWVILLSVMTVLMKINAPLLLLPILLYLGYQTRDRFVVVRTAVVSVAVFMCYMLFQAIYAGDLLYAYHHWSTLDYATTNFGKNVLPYLWDYVVSWGLWLSIPLIVAGIVLTLKRRMKAWYGFAAFGLVTLAYAWGWGFYSYQVFPVMYASMFAIPVIWFNAYIKKEVVVEQG